VFSCISNAKVVAFSKLDTERNLRIWNPSQQGERTIAQMCFWWTSNAKFKLDK